MRVTGFDGGATPTHQNTKEVTLMLHSSERIIRHKLGLLNLAEELGNVSRACRVMGPSWDTFFRYQKAVEEGVLRPCWSQTAVV